MDPASALPAELWLYIHRLATSATSPMVVASADRYRYDPVTDPLTDIEHFWRVRHTFVVYSYLISLSASILLRARLQAVE
jgi:hypothetical protein